MAERPPRRRRAQEALLARLDEIRDTADRRQSLALLDLLLDGTLDDEQTAQVTDALVVNEDPRCAPALLQAVHDPRRAFCVRAGAIEILSATPCADPPRPDVRAWAGSHDPLVRALGVQYLDAPEGELIAAAASDPEPVVRRVAMESMASLVRTPALVAATRRALRDEDALVREIACRVALFDEPLEASWDLLRALSDPSAIVRAAAFDALEWYPRVSVLLALADARSSSEDPAPADAVLAALVGRIVAAFAGATPAARRRLERWAGPVAWLLDASARRGADAGDDAGGATDGDAADAAVPEGGGTAPPRVDLDEAERVLPDLDASPIAQREILLRRSWLRTGRRGLELLRACAASPNWALRQMSARPFAALGAMDDLAGLAFDPEPVVRRAAFVAAIDRPDLGDERFLDAARDALADPWVRPTAGDHALALVAAHGGPDEVEATVLAELSRPDDRDGLFLGAIHLARLAGVRRAVPALLALVNAPVVSSVAAHVAALQTLRSLRHPRTRIDLRHLDGVDHLDVQRELGEWGWHGGRW